MIDRAVEKQPLARPSWLPESVWPFETFGMDVDGIRLAVTVGFQRRWKELFPEAVEMVVPKGNHFPMCGAPDLVAQTIRSWHAAKLDFEAVEMAAR